MRHPHLLDLKAHANVRASSALVHVRAIAGLLLIFCASAAVQARSGPSSPQEFARDYIAAIRSHDLATLEALSHPATLACVNNSTRPYFEQGFADELKLGATLQAGYKLSSVKPVTGTPMLGLLPADGFSYPVRPTVLIQIEANDKGGNSATLFHYLAKSGSGWFTVDPCPNAKGLQFFAAQREEGERQIAEGGKLVRTMPASLRAHLKALVVQGRWVQAVNEYRNATGADMSSALKVVDALREGI